MIPLGLACRRSLAEFLEPDEIFAITRAGLDYYTDLFGMGYPFAKYDQVFVTDSVGAMENPGCVTIGEQMLFRSKVTGTMRELPGGDHPARDVAHVVRRPGHDEVVGRSVAERVVRRNVRQPVERRGDQVHRCLDHVLRRPQDLGIHPGPAALTHPIAADAPTLSVAESNFDGISYAKGASVLKQLVAYLGRDNFFAGIRAYLAGHAWGNATLADLLRALEASSGKALGDWSKAWLQTAGPNTLRSEFATDDKGNFTEFAVLQEAPAKHPTLRPHHIAIGLYNRDSRGALVRTHRVEAEVAGYGRQCRTSSACSSRTCCCSTMTISATRSSGSTSARWPR